MSSIGLILLAAGASTRMGTPKQLLPYAGRTLLRHAAQTALASPCRPVVVVLGADADRLRPEIQDLPLQIIANLDWEQGMGSSLRAGMRALPEERQEVEAVIIMLCDQPHISASSLQALITTYRTERSPIVAAEYDDTLGVPVLFDRSLFAELAALEGAAGAKKLIYGNREKAVGIPLLEGRIDIDTPQDYALLLDRDRTQEER